METGHWVRRANRWLVQAPLGLEGERVLVVTRAGRSLHVQLGVCAIEDEADGCYVVRDDAVAAHRRWVRDARARGLY